MVIDYLSAQHFWIISRKVLASRALVLNTARVGNVDDIDEDIDDDDADDDYIIMTCTIYRWRCLWVVSSAAADAKNKRVVCVKVTIQFK